MIRADLLVTDIGELATLARGPVPRIGKAAEELGLLTDAALAVAGGRFAWVGRERALSRAVRLRPGGRRLSANGGVVVPGFVDAHTHVLFAGDRAFELPLKVRGVGYAEIARAGGGLYATVRATRAASDAGPARGDRGSTPTDGRLGNHFGRGEVGLRSHDRRRAAAPSPHPPARPTYWS